jgi:2-desacetyl-2-hydroxyethyl bacteriochlorophyllide A dehydrogenase
MKSIVCNQPGKFLYEERDYPLSRPGYSIIKLKQIGICGTDLNAFKGIQPYFSYPRVLGHELAAEYVEGDAEGFSTGDLLAILPYKSCGNCFACKLGKTNCCSSLSVLGVHEDGGMSEYILVPNDLLIKTEDLSLDQIALIEPLAIGAHAVKRAAIQNGEHVLVIGAGPIGIGLLYFLSMYDVNIILAEKISNRLNFCTEYFKHVHCIDTSNKEYVNEIGQLTNNNMPSLIFDATGNLNAIHQSFSLLSHAGRFVLVGLQQGEIHVNHPEFHKREAMLMSSRNATVADFQSVIEAMRNKQIHPQQMITHRIPFDQVVHEFPTLYSQKDAVIKAMITC